MKGRSNKEWMLYAAVIYLMVMSLNLAVKDSTGMSMPLLNMALYTLLAVLGVFAAALQPLLLLAAAAVASGWVGYLYVKHPAVLESMWHSGVRLAVWLYGYVVGYRHFEPEYARFFACTYILLVVAIASAAAFSKRGALFLILSGIAAFSFFWFIYVEKARLYLMLYLFAALILYTFHTYKRKKREWDISNSPVEAKVLSNWMFSATVMIILTISSVLLVPLNISPVRWDWLNNRMVRLFPFMTEWRNDTMESYGFGFNSRYSLSAAGYRGKSQGGPVQPDKAVMMTVETGSTDNLYLRGTVKDVYDGLFWSKSAKGYQEYRPGTVLPLPDALDATQSYLETFIIKPEKLLTSTIFAPYAVYEVASKSGKIFVDEDTEAYFSRMVMPDQRYTVRSMMPYLDEAAVRHGEEGGKALPPIYTRLPGNMPERVLALASELTAGFGNDYDKAKAIEQYLRSRYRYTLKPGSVPQGREFVDYFLFEGKEGYCTYFATAMAVMLRASGIPCRYVEGFLSRYEGETVRSIRGMDAHAWVEAYFKGTGWLVFEATPQYPAVSYRKPNRSKEEEEGAGEPLQAEAALKAVQQLSRNGSLAVDNEDQTDVGKLQTDKTTDYGKMLIQIAGLLVLLRILQMMMLRLIKELRIRKAQGTRHAALYLEDLLNSFHRAGFAIEADETLRVFFARVRHNYQEKLAEAQMVLELIEKARYGGVELKQQERNLMEVFRKKMKALARARQGLIRHTLSVYLIGK